MTDAKLIAEEERQKAMGKSVLGLTVPTNNTSIFDTTGQSLYPYVKPQPPQPKLINRVKRYLTKGDK